MKTLTDIEAEDEWLLDYLDRLDRVEDRLAEDRVQLRRIRAKIDSLERIMKGGGE